jgi:hypothetical protein
MRIARWLVYARRWLGTRSGRRGVKLMVVAGGLLWCSSWPAFLGGPQPRGESLATKAAREIDAPVELHLVPPDEAAARVRALLTRRAPGDLARARALLDSALAASPRERERRRGLERLRAALARLEREEKALGANLHAAAVDPSRTQGSGKF